jgi:hypothetical protein
MSGAVKLPESQKPPTDSADEPGFFRPIYQASNFRRGSLSFHLPLRNPPAQLKGKVATAWRLLATLAITSLLAGKWTSSNGTTPANDRQDGAFGLGRTRWLAKEQGIQSLPESRGLSAQNRVMWIGEIGIKADRRALEKDLDIRPQELPARGRKRVEIERREAHFAVSYRPGASNLHGVRVAALRSLL